MSPLIYVVGLAEAMNLRRSRASISRARMRLFASGSVVQLAPMILLVCYQLKMVGTNATAMLASIVTKASGVIGMTTMIPLKSRWWLTDKDMVCEHGIAPGIAIASLGYMTSPEPARLGLFDAGKETLFWRRVGFAERLTLRRLAPALVMHLAQAIAGNRPAAFGLGAGNGTLGSHLNFLSGVTVPDVSASRHPFILPEGAF